MADETYFTRAKIPDVQPGDYYITLNNQSKQPALVPSLVTHVHDEGFDCISVLYKQPATAGEKFHTFTVGWGVFYDPHPGGDGIILKRQRGSLEFLADKHFVDAVRNLDMRWKEFQAVRSR